MLKNLINYLKNNYKQYLKTRYIVASAIIITSIVITPLLMDIAYAGRGYEAYGGECLISPMIIFSTVCILDSIKQL